MTRAFRLLSFQAATLAASVLLMSAVPAITRAASPATAAPAAASIQIDNFTFKAPTLTVKTGTTVTWTNRDDIPHTVVSKDGVFKSKVLDTGDQFSFNFAKPGQFGYYCSLHPHMTGTIVVKG